MNDEPVEFTVWGDPKPQGSKRHVGNGVLVESSGGLKDWRTDLTITARRAMDGRLPLDGPLQVSLRFAVKRPRSLPKKRRYPTARPDADKLVRAVFDALSAGGVWRDDAQAVTVHATKRFPDPDGQLPIPGVWVHVQPLDLDQPPRSVTPPD